MKSLNVYYNPNPLKKETSDCVVRSLCKATGYSWDHVYRSLFDIGFELKVMPSDDEAWKEFLIREGFVLNKISNKKGSKRPTVESFTRSHKEGIFILRVANHLVTSYNGKYYDIFDSGSSSLYGYWSKI